VLLVGVGVLHKSQSSGNVKSSRGEKQKITGKCSFFRERLLWVNIVVERTNLTAGEPNCAVSSLLNP